MSIAKGSIGLLVAMVAGIAGNSAPADARDPVSLLPRVEQGTTVLRPGQFLWYDNVAQPVGGKISLVVSIPSQLAYVYRDGVLLGVSTASTGKPGKETPLGAFPILEKKSFHRSNIYSNAPMPFMQRLTWTGIALHAGHLPGYPASHGCIRLPAAFAKQLFQLTSLGATVRVVNVEIHDPGYNGFAPAPRLRADPGALGGEAFNVVTASLSPEEAQAEMQPVSLRPGRTPLSTRRYRR